MVCEVRGITLMWVFLLALDLTSLSLDKLFLLCEKIKQESQINALRVVSYRFYFQKAIQSCHALSKQYFSSYQGDSAKAGWKITFLPHESDSCFQLQIRTIEGLNMGHPSPRKLLVTSDYLENCFTSRFLPDHWHSLKKFFLEDLDRFL